MSNCLIVSDSELPASAQCQSLRSTCQGGSRFLVCKVFRTCYDCENKHLNFYGFLDMCQGINVQQLLKHKKNVFSYISVCESQTWGKPPNATV